MSKKRKKPKQRQIPVSPIPAPSHLHSLEQEYERACHFAEQAKFSHARRCYGLLVKAASEPGLKARIQNDLGTLKFLEGDRNAAKVEFETALQVDSHCEAAKTNLAFLEAVLEPALPIGVPLVPATSKQAPAAARVRVAILSFLFNWPSTGGGNVHTFELAIFLKRAGFEVRHLYVRHSPWGIGNVPEVLPFPSEGLEFTDATWNATDIQKRFRDRIEVFQPDHVIITDSWNFKPLLAEAVAGFPYILRMQALECLCPLNNIRLLPKDGGGVRQCQLHQMATPMKCGKCIVERGGNSGFLHQAERALSGVGTPEYQETLVRAFQNAEAVLVVNPLSEAMISPYTTQVRVVTSGMDPGRFPWPNPAPQKPDGRIKLLFAGLVEELMKGFDTLQEACSLLCAKRQDFELLATADPPGQANEFTQFVGWLSQDDLPAQLQACDILMMPTIAQEALGRTAVEAMAAGRPVIASRLGGLPFTVVDGATGLLCEPGDPEDLARKIETLLDDPELRQRLGQAGRKRFEEHYSWPVIIERHYRPLLDRPRTAASGVPVSSLIVQPTSVSQVRPQIRPAAGYAPVIPERINQAQLEQEVAGFFGLQASDVRGKERTYRSFHDAKRYAQALGERKTLCLEESFVLYVLLSQTRPKVVVEIGTQQGKSARRILDMMALLDLQAQLICIDIENQVQFFAHEAKFVQQDVTGFFSPFVLETYQPDLVFLDVHGFHLLTEVVSSCRMHPRPPKLVSHDCGPGLCNQHMTISRDDPNVTSFTGTWERYVLAKEFGMADPLSAELDQVETERDRLRIFGTPHGLGVVMPKW